MAAPALRLERHDLDDLLRSLSDGVILLTSDGHITYASPPIRATLGYDPTLLVGRPLRVFLHPDEVEEAGQLLLDSPRPHRDGGPAAVPKRQRHGGGWREVDVTPP